MLGTDVLRPGTGMPLDHTSYLLSSSPPGLGLEFLSSGLFSEHLSSAERSFCSHAPIYIEQRFVKKTITIPKPIITPDSPQSYSEPTSPVCPSPRRSQSPSKQKKSVTFADCFGLALATIRIMTEPSEIPPMLRPEVLSNITKGSTASVTSIPPLTLRFTQPAAQYLAFRDRVEKNCISLENIILKDYQVTGTIKVKNIAFEKDVIVRFTFDSWETIEEMAASYVNNNGCSQFDTFTFELNVPTDFDIQKHILFAVSYKTDGKEYWDNNYGRNYLIVSSYLNDHPKPYTDCSLNVEADTPPAFWNEGNQSIPYW